MLGRSFRKRMYTAQYNDMSEVMTIRVESQGQEPSRKAGSGNGSYLAAEAIRAYVDLNEWQMAEITAA
jgi:predicted transcriptional regulator